MLYKRADLPTNMKEDHHVAIRRYMYKFFNHRKEIAHLKWHEKFYLFSHIPIITFQDGYTVDLYSIPEAKDYLFYYITLLYCSNTPNIDFTKATYDYNGKIPAKLRKKQGKFFYKCLSEWEEQLIRHKGWCLEVLYPEYSRKIKTLESNSHLLLRERLAAKTYRLATFHHIYCMLQLYYDEKVDKYDIIKVDGYNIIADVYSYCHVLSRHYFPVMMSGDSSLNEDIPIIDIKNLPISLLNLVKLYGRVTSLTPLTEYLLFEYNDIKYILWVKYGLVSHHNLIGFQIRTLYRCVSKCDMDKYIGKQKVSIDAHLSCYI